MSMTNFTFSLYLLISLFSNIYTQDEVILNVNENKIETQEYVRKPTCPETCKCNPCLCAEPCKCGVIESKTESKNVNE